MRNKGLEVVAVSLGRKDDRLIRYIRDAGFSFRVIAAVQPSKDIGPLAKRYGMPGPMATFLIDHSGRIVFRDYDSDYGELRAAIETIGRARLHSRLRQISYAPFCLKKKRQ